MIAPSIPLSDIGYTFSPDDAYLAFAIVAIEIPVEPTVPSNILEPVFGCSSPIRSASSITAASVKREQRTRHIQKGRGQHGMAFTSKCDAIFDASPRIQKLGIHAKNIESAVSIQCQCVTLTSAFPSISTPNASLSEFIRINGVFPGIPPCDPQSDSQDTIICTAMQTTCR